MPAWDTEALLRADLDAPMRADLADALEAHERQRGERERLAARQAEVAALKVQHEARRRRLSPPLPPDGLDPARLVVPPASEVARFEALYAADEREGAARAARLAAASARLRANEEERAAILSGGHAPTEDELRGARARRDAGLRMVEKALLLGASSVEDEVKRYGEGAPLPRAFERGVRLADEVVDRMRLRADAVQRRALLEARARAPRGGAGRGARGGAGRGPREDGARAALRGLFAGAGFEPLAPASMRTWLDDRLAYLEIDREARRGAGARDALAEELAREEAAWRARWSGILAAVGLSPDLSVARARRVIEELAQLRAELTGRRRDLGDALARARASSASYESEARAVLAGAGIALADPARAVEEAFSRVQVARDAARTCEELERARLADERSAKAVLGRLEEAERALGELRALAGAEDDEGVRRVAQRSLRADELERAIAEAEPSLRRAGVRWGYEAWIAEVETARPELLERRVAQAVGEADALRREARAIDQEVGALAEGLARTGEASRAADEQSEMEGLRASLAEEVERYAVVSFAEAILRGGIRRFEQEHQSELIASASRLFHAMTGGRCYGGSSGASTASLFAVRDGGRALAPDALSTDARAALRRAAPRLRSTTRRAPSRCRWCSTTCSSTSTRRGRAARWRRWRTSRPETRSCVHVPPIAGRAGARGRARCPFLRRPSWRLTSLVSSALLRPRRPGGGAGAARHRAGARARRGRRARGPHRGDGGLPRPEGLGVPRAGGLTKRTRTLFGPPGFAYVFLITGCTTASTWSASGRGRGTPSWCAAPSPSRDPRRGAHRRAGAHDARSASPARTTGSISAAERFT